MGTDWILGPENAISIFTRIFAMVSTDTIALLHQLWWLQWVLIYTIPMFFYFVARLVAMPAILDMVATHAQRNASSKAGGVLLGLLEDLVATTLLAASLVVVDLIGVVLSRVLLLRFRERPYVLLVLRRIGLVLRFLVALALTVTWLTFFAGDLLLVCVYGFRLTPAFDLKPSNARDHIRHDVFFETHIIVGVGGVSVLLAGLFSWAMDLAHWLPTASIEGETRRPNHTSMERTRFSSTSNPSDIMPTFVVLHRRFDEADFETGDQDVDIDGLDDSHISIASSPVEVDEYHAINGEMSLLSEPMMTRKPQSPSHRHRTTAIVVAIIIAFFIVTGVTLAIAKAASPIVASIALNSTVNEIFRGILGTQFLPTGLPQS